MASSKEEEKLLKMYQASLKSAKGLKEVDVVMDSISQKILGMGTDAWFSQGVKSAEQLVQEQLRIKKLTDDISLSQGQLNEKLKESLTTEDARVGIEDKLGHLKKMSLESFSSHLSRASGLSDIEKSILASSGSMVEKHKMINKLLKGKLDLTQDVNRELAVSIAGHTEEAEGINNINNELSEGVALLAETEVGFAEPLRDSLDVMKGINQYSKVFSKGVVEFVFDFDQAISNAQKDTGIFFKQNTQGMADLTSRTRHFGMSIEQTTELMGVLGDGLKSTNFEFLKSATEDFAAIQKGIGISAEELGGISNEMMFFGSSSKDVKEYFESINSTSQSLGINTRNVVRQITQNIGKMRQFGFSEGEKSLERMAAKAEMLGINLSGIFDVAEKARTLEGALGMAAELQLAGGSFSQINPMDLLAAARKGPKELGDILTKMGSDVGDFNKETGKYEFNAVDIDRLKIVANATDLSLDDIQKSIAKTATIAAKTDVFGNMFSGADKMEKELAKGSLAKMLDLAADGTITVSKDFEKIFAAHGVSNENLAKMDKDKIEEILKASKAEQESVEKRAESNKSLTEAFSSFIGSIQSMFGFLEPVLIALSDVFNFVGDFMSQLSENTKKGVSAMLFLAYAIRKMPQLKNLKNSIGEKLKSGFTRKRGEEDSSGGISSKAGSGGGMKSLSEGLKSMSGKKVRSGIANVAFYGPAGLLGLLGVPFLLGVGALGWIGGQGLAGLAIGLGAFNGKRIKSGITNVALFGPAALAGGFGLPFLIGVGALGWAGGQGLAGLAIGLGAFNGKRIKSGIANLALFGLAGALATLSLPFLLGVGLLGGFAAVGLTALAGGLSAFGNPATAGFVLTGIALIGALGLAMIPFGIALSYVGDLVGAIGTVMSGIPPIIGALADGFVKVFSVMTLGNAAAMYMMAGAMGSMALATMAFANPMSMGGLFVMSGSLAVLAAVMSPLASSLAIGADGMERFASAIGKLKSAVADINVSKLEEIQETASQLASASRSSSLDRVAATIQGLVGGGSSGSSNRNSERKIVVEIQMDGKVLQSKILKDTRQMTGN